MSGSPLRVAIAVDSMRQPAWVCRVVDHVRTHHALSQVVVVRPRSRGRLPLLARLYQRLDRKIFGRSSDGLTPCDLAARPEPVAASSALDTGAADVVIAFAQIDTPHPEIWSIEMDGWNEFAARKPLPESVLKSGERVRARVTAMYEPFAFRRAMSRLGLRTAAMLEHELDRRARGAEAPPVRVPQRTNAPPAGAMSTIVRAAASAGGFLKEKYREKYIEQQWSIAFSFDAAAHDDLSRYHAIIPPADRLWADPFVIADGDRAWIFIEEMLFSEKRGVLAVLEARRDGSWSPPQRILERPFHLSYPCVFRWNDELFMVPDTRRNGTIELYRCVDVPLRWELDTVLMPNIDAVDTTVFEEGGHWWMYFASPAGDKAAVDRLWLYHAPTPRGPWTSHRWNPLECDVVGGRPGGRPFRRDGRLMRGVQIGTPYYGHSLGLREIVTLTPDAWEERQTGTIGPHGGYAGIHTLNVDGHVAVVDRMRFWRRR
jgi:hypothetical protein